MALVHLAVPEHMVAGDSAGNAARANTGSGGGGGAQATGDWEMVVALVSMLRL